MQKKFRKLEAILSFRYDNTTTEGANLTPVK